MQPTIYEIACYVILVIALGGWLGWALYRDSHPKHNDDPYRYCPKEEQ